MNGTGYRILGYAVWHGGKWYARQRLPSMRSIALSAATAAGGLATAALLARKLAA